MNYLFLWESHRIGFTTNVEPKLQWRKVDGYATNAYGILLDRMEGVSGCYLSLSVPHFRNRSKKIA